MTRSSTPSSTGSRRRWRRATGCVDDYRARLATIGRSVRVEHVRDADLVGTAVGITAAGALVVRDDAGTDHTVVAADVHHLR